MLPFNILWELSYSLVLRVSREYGFASGTAEQMYSFSFDGILRLLSEEELAEPSRSVCFLVPTKQVVRRCVFF